MARWEPGARERMVLAAVDLFTEQGYDATTVAQIAERAGVTKSTFFRHFPDKRELLVAGQEALSRLLAEGIAEAPQTASPLEAVAAGLERASSAMGPMNRELGPRLKAAIAASAELQERDALKSVGLAAAMTNALRGTGRAGPDRAPCRRDGRPRVQTWLCRMAGGRPRHRGRTGALHRRRPGRPTGSECVAQLSRSHPRHLCWCVSWPVLEVILMAQQTRPRIRAGKGQ